MTPRQQRAVDLVASGVLDQITEVAPGFYLVPSAHEGAFYVTTRDGCTCPDANYRGAVCKHQIILRLRGVIEETAPQSASGAEQGTRQAVDAWAASHRPTTTVPARMRATRED